MRPTTSHRRHVRPPATGDESDHRLAPAIGDESHHHATPPTHEHERRNRSPLTAIHYHRAPCSRTVFNRFDENRDGKISASELRLCLGTIGGEISESEAVVLLADSDGDELLGLEDFVRLVEGTEEEEKVKHLKEAFKMYEEMDECGTESSITPRSLKRCSVGLGRRRALGSVRL
ncbi:hypothetical protein Vadar_009179 [Vaccinium darrowii]|uniref:Uncharacterized protein n=1 Tax=Vaccinium darrowii TaxID=229202 RepID=A0ACB7ZAI8_9ERIC|nr:hypothetical protein Vadar_009179 [Vaccinium darrowii]